MGNLLSSPEEQEAREQERLRKAQEDAAMYQRIIEYRRQQELARERARLQQQQERERLERERRLREQQERERLERERRLREQQERERLERERRLREQQEERERQAQVDRWFTTYQQQVQERAQEQQRARERERARLVSIPTASWHVARDDPDRFYYDDSDDDRENYNRDYPCRPMPISSSQPRTSTRTAYYNGNGASTSTATTNTTTANPITINTTLPQVIQTMDKDPWVSNDFSPVYHHDDRNEREGYAYVKPSQEDNWRTRRKTEKAEQSARNCGRRSRGRRARGDLFEDDFHAGHTRQEIRDMCQERQANHEAQYLRAAGRPK
ncbi:hypothetical protein BGX34_006344 [Mortierella sp. NVP85]|nr:hypothetical protein BGX34_006344 [Mortierella sp. NVP85]